MKNTKQQYKYLSLIILLYFIVITSCKVKIKLLNKDTNELKINTLITNIEDNYLDYNTISVKFSAKYRSENKKQNIQGVYRIKRDSIIWFSMGPSLGLEILRAELLKDTLKFINRFDKTYYSGNYQYINKLTNMNFNYNSIERILTNKLIYNDIDYNNWKDYVTQNFNYSISEGKYILNNKEVNKNQLNNTKTLINYLDSIVVLPTIYKIQKIVWSDKEKNRKLILVFSNFKKFKTNIFPENITLLIKENKKNIEINLKIKQINFERKSKYPFKIPKKKYVKIQMNE